MLSPRICLFCSQSPVATVLADGTWPLCQRHAEEWVREEAVYLGAAMPLVKLSTEEPTAMPSQTCHFCRGAAEQRSRDGRLICCRKCAKEQLLPLLIDALGPAEVSSAADDAAGQGRGVFRPINQPFEGRRPVLPLGATAMSAGTGRPVKVPRGKFTSAEVTRRLNLAMRKDSVRNPPPAPTRQEIEADVRRAGFAVGGKSA
jgi:hypothetical protein